MNFDIIFLDTTSNKYYDRMVLEKQPLGGTEATVVRVAEGLASLGLKVAVVQSQVPYFEPVMGQHCFFMHSNEIENMTCKHFVQIRRNLNPTLFPNSQHYIWMHDVATDEKSWVPDLVANNIKLIGVSKWHKKQIRDVTEYDNVDYIYNPVPDEIYTTIEAKYDPNVMVWMSSPHKGLGKALEMFKTVRESNPHMQLIVFNPGYFQLDPSLGIIPGVSVYGPMACRHMWNVVQRSLCVFYPTQWDETFGLVAAEANALGTPVATYPRAALKEIVSSKNQMVKTDNESELIKKVLDWSKCGRPVIKGKEEFKFSNVIMEWVKLLAN